MTHDLVVAGGHVLCPATGVDGIADVAIDDGRIAAVGEGLAGRERVDAGGLLVVPGLIDLHVHVYDGVSHYGIDADTYLLRRGTTTGVDVGSAGAQTFPGLRRMVIDQAQTRIYAYLHIAVEGMISVLVGELEDIRWASVEQCVRVAEANRDVIVGVKLRAGYQMVGPDPRPAVGLALEAADALGLPLMVHVIDMGMPLPELLARMRPGDVVTHCFHGNDGGLLDDDGRVLARGVRRARARHPLRRRPRRRLVHLARRARGARTGLPARHDLERHPRPQPRRARCYDLPRTLSKLLHLGMPLRDVIAAATARVGAHLAHVAPAGLGTLAPGRAGRPQPARAAARQLRARPTASTGSRQASPSTPGERLVARTGRARRRGRRVRRAGVTSLRIAGGRVVAHGGVLDGADVLVEDGHVVAVGETVAGRARAGCARVLRAAGRRRSARARLRGPRRRAARRAALGHHAARGLRGPRARRARRGRLRALGRARGRRAVPDRAARDRLRARMRSTRPRSRRSRPAACAASSSSSPIASSAWTPATTCCCARCCGASAHGVVPRLHCENAGAIQVLRERLRAAGDLGDRRASPLAAAARRGGGHPPRARPRATGRCPGLHRPRLDRRRRRCDPRRRAPTASTSSARPARSTCCSTSASTPGRSPRWAWSRRRCGRARTSRPCGRACSTAR